jgi:hypothetical protein
MWYYLTIKVIFILTGERNAGISGLQRNVAEPGTVLAL